MRLSDKAIGQALGSVFAHIGAGVRANMGFVVATVMKELDITPEASREAESKIKAYIMRVHKRGGKYQVASGKGGGVFIRTPETNISHRVKVTATVTVEIGPTTLPSEAQDIIRKSLKVWKESYNVVRSDPTPKVLDIEV